MWPVGVQPLAANAEIVRVTSKGTGDDWTIGRTQEGSSARAILVGDQISATITKKTLTDIEEAVSVVSQALSVETAARVAKDDLLSNAVSVVSQGLSVALVSIATLSNVASAEAVTRAAADDALSQAVSVVSQALSVETAARVAADNALSDALSVEASNRTSVYNLLTTEISSRVAGDNSLSNRISIVSNAASAASALARNAVSIHDLLSNVVSNELSVRAASVQTASAAATSVLAYISGVSALSTGGVSTHGLQSVINALSNRISAAGGGGGSVTSTELSAVSAQAASAINVVSSNLATLSLAVSVISDRLSAVVSGASARSVGDVSTHGHQSILNALSNRISVASAAATSADGHAATASAAATSADAHAAAASAAATSVAAVGSLAVSVVSHAVSVLSQANSVAHASLSNLISTASAAATSADAHAAAASAAATSVQNLLSQAISVVSNAVSVVSQAASAADAHASVASVAAASVNARVTSVNTFLDNLSVKTSLTGTSVKGLQSVLNAISQRISVEAPLGGGGGSVTSTEVSAVSAQAASAINAEISNRTSADNAVSAQALSANNVLSQAIGVLSQQVSVLSALGNIISLQNVDASAVSAGAPVYLFTSADTFKRANASVIASRQFAGLVIDSVIAVSAVGRVQTDGPVTLTTGQWDSITGGSGGLTAGSVYYIDLVTGLLTTTQNASTRRVGVARSTTVLQLQPGQSDDFGVLLGAIFQSVSAQSVLVAGLISTVSVLSQGLSVLSQAVSVADAALSDRIDAIPGGGSVAAPGWNSVAHTISATGLTNVSGLSVSVSAGGIYELDCNLVINRAGISTVTKVGMTFPAMAQARGDARLQMSAAIASIGVTAQGLHVCWDGGFSGSVMLSHATSQTRLSTHCKIDGVMAVSTTGTVQVQAAVSATAQHAVFLRGSYVRVTRIN